MIFDVISDVAGDYYSLLIERAGVKRIIELSGRHLDNRIVK